MTTKKVLKTTIKNGERPTFKLDLIVITENVGFEIKTITASKITRVRNRFNRFGTSKLFSLALFKFFYQKLNNSEF